MHAGLAEDAAAHGRRLTAGEAWARATVAYHFAKFVWMVDPQLSRSAADKAVAAMARTHEYLDPAAERLEVPARRGPRGRATCAGPAGEDRPPLVLLVPGLDSTKEEFFRLENVFLDRGMATLSMDGPGQGESGYDLPIRPDYDVAVASRPRRARRARRRGPRPGRAAGREPRRLLRARACSRSSRRVKAGVGLSGPYKFSDIWETVPPQTRETFVAKSFAKDDEEGRGEGLRSST